MSNLALITGASSGIGMELAREHASRGGHVILVARSRAPMEALAKELEANHGVRAYVREQDLSQLGGVASLTSWLSKHKHKVDVLINNAGVGGYGLFVERNIKDDLSMMQLNMASLSELTHALLPGMIERGSGRVLHVGSTAGFVPGPKQATYFATKAFVNSFSQALSYELKGTGVTSTVLCPGPVDTGFEGAAGMPKVKAFKRAVTATQVAKDGYAAMEKGRLVVVSPKSMSAIRMAGLLPRKSILMATSKSMTSD